MAGADLFAPSRRPTVPTVRELLGSSRATLRSLSLVAAAIGGVVFVCGYLIAWSQGIGAAYLGAFTTQVVLLGIVVGPIVLFWFAAYHLRVWTTIRNCFAVDDETYADAIDPLLERMYSLGRITGEFLGAVALVLVWNVGLRNPIPYAIWVEGYVWSEHLLFGGAVGVDALSAINYLYGVVALFTVVAGVHGVAYFLRLVRRVADLPLDDVAVAAERLEPLARFSVAVATTAFLAAVLLMVVYSRLLGVADGSAADLASFAAGHAFVVMVIVTALVGVGLAAFCIPQLEIHDALMAAKHDRLLAVEREYDALLDRAKEASASSADLGTELEILEAQRRNAQEIDTWSYNLPSLVPVVGSGIASTVTWLLSVTGQLAPLLG